MLLATALFFAALCLVLMLALWLSNKREIALVKAYDELGFELDRCRIELDYVRESYRIADPEN